MTQQETKKSYLNLTNVIAILALIVAILGLPFFEDIFPSHDTKISLFHSSVNIDEGRLGRGPQVTLGINFSNTGNRAITITEINVRFPLGFHDGEIDNCETEDYTWMGVPWDKFIKPSTSVKAMPFQIQPGTPHSEVVTFEPANLLTDNERKEFEAYRAFCCIEITFNDSNTKKHTKKIPIAYVRYDDERILDLSLHPSYSEIISLF